MLRRVNAAGTRCKAIAPAAPRPRPPPVSRFDGKTWTTYTTADGLVNNSVSAIAGGPDGALWFGTGGGVSRYLPPR